MEGLFVMETFLKSPEAFDFYIAMDPSLWWNAHYLDKNAANYLARYPEIKSRLWFASSSTEGMANATNNIINVLQKLKPKGLIWNYSDEPNEKHNTIFRATKEKALIWIFNVKEAKK